jgi:putative endonuclease
MVLDCRFIHRYVDSPNGVIPAKAGIQRLVRMSKQPAVYILASARNGSLYVGVTAFLLPRISLHREGTVPGFTERYGIHRLVHYEWLPDLPTAIRREKQIKGWKRAWKIALIERGNPYWRDLWRDIAG